MKNRIITDNFKLLEFDRINYGEFAIIKSQATSHETLGNKPRHHFAGAGKVIEVGQRQVEE